MTLVIRRKNQKEEEDTQAYQETSNCRSLVPGMSQYGESDGDTYVGTAQPGGLSFSTDAACNTTLPFFSNGSQGSNSLTVIFNLPFGRFFLFVFSPGFPFKHVRAKK